jgi:hypothetical protein
VQEEPASFLVKRGIGFNKKARHKTTVKAELFRRELYNRYNNLISLVFKVVKNILLINKDVATFVI